VIVVPGRFHRDGHHLPDAPPVFGQFPIPLAFLIPFQVTLLPDVLIVRLQVPDE
jgi:hypothetical protein